MNSDSKEQAAVAANSGTDYPHDSNHNVTSTTAAHGAPEVLDTTERTNNSSGDNSPQAHIPWKTKLRYFLTKEFWLVLAIGQVLAISNTSTSTLTTLLADAGTSIPAFQSLFNYILLFLIYTSYTVYKYGFKKWLRLLRTDGWKYFILSFCDCQGNYFTVLAYRYTTILSAQLINFWAIAIVVFISFTFLRVRYHWAQVLGIFVCIGGFGILLASDHLTGADGGDEISRGDQIKGDLFALVGATCYGLSNVAEEFLVSKAPLYEVIGQMGFWGMFINGVQAAIFDRHSFQIATWNGKVGGYLTGYTLILTLFYSIAPILYRLASAAFMNISLLTGNFWGVIIGIKVFHYTVHYLYPIAFTLIMIGHFVYYFGKGVLGEATKAWLGKDQEKGFSGMFTARAKIENAKHVMGESVVEANGTRVPESEHMGVV